MENKTQVVTTSFLNKVMPMADLPKKEGFGRLYKGVPLRFQLVIKTDKTIIDGVIKIESKLNNVKIQRVAYVNSQLPVREDFDDYIVSSSPGLYPDCIFDVNIEKVRLSGGINNSFYVTVCDERNLAKGVYPIEISILNGNALIEKVEYQVEYTAFEFSKREEIIYANWIHYDSIVKLHRVEPFSDEFYSILKSYVDLFKVSGANLIMIPLITPPLDTYVGGSRELVQLVDIEKNGDKYSFDFSKLDRFIDFVKDEGIDKYEFPPFFSQWGAKYSANIIVAENGEQKSYFGWKSEALSKEYVELLTQLLKNLNKYLDEKGILNNCYFHVSDETDKCKEHYLKCKEIVTGNLHGVKYMDTVTKAENFDKNDIQVLAVSETVNMTDLSDIKAIYYCWGDYKNYVSNRFFSMPLERTAVIWTQLYLNSAELFLQWGFNFYQDYLSYNYIDPFFDSTAGGIFPSGDAFIVYPDIAKAKALSSVRLEAIAYGKELLSMLYTLEEKTSKDFVIEKLQKFGFKGYTDYPRYDGWMKDFEDFIYEEIIKTNEN